DGPDGPVPDSVFEACVAVLREWDWAVRPTSVLALQSERHPILTRSLAERLAEVGRLRPLGTMPLRPERPPVRAATPAPRVRGLDDSWAVPAPSGVERPVLLVDAQPDTGWTFTVAAHALRRAGAEAVLPFALASVT